MFICLIPKIGTKYSLAKGLGTQYRDVSENEVFHFMVLSVRGSRAVKPRRGCCRVRKALNWRVWSPGVLSTRELATHASALAGTMLPMAGPSTC